jgi:hypothetical protein
LHFSDGDDGAYGRISTGERSVLENLASPERDPMEGSVIRETAGGRVLARHADHRWQVDGTKYFRLDCADLVSIQMEDGER